MANFRQIHVSIWKDAWFLDLEPDEKLLFVYLFSNESTSLSGIYRLARKVMHFETGLTKERASEILDKFQEAGKVYYQGDIVWIVNMRKYHETKSSKVATRIKKDLELIPDCELKQKYIAYCTPNIPYGYPMDTPPQLKEDEKENEDADNTGNAYRIYEENIGSLTSVIANSIDDAMKEYSPLWVEQAIIKAAQMEKRSWSYCNGILKGWRRDGFNTGHKPSAPANILADMPYLGE
jgi:DnaD/phage-associated family protein